MTTSLRRPQKMPRLLLVTTQTAPTTLSSEALIQKSRRAHITENDRENNSRLSFH